MIAIIDYGLGNVRAFVEIYRRLNIPVMLGGKPTELEKADKIILPGVGAFDNAMQLLDRSGLTGILNELVLDRAVPFLGVCVGMQILGNSSEEGVLPGFGWIPGKVKKIHTVHTMQYAPHMGWNQIETVKESRIFEHLDPNARFYFLHSYVFNCDCADDVAAVTHYGEAFTCAINRKNIYGVQFHPEKSHNWGIQLLKDFSEI